MIENGYDKTMLQSEIRSKNLSLIMDCIADFLMVLPWSKWLKQSGKRTTVMMPTASVTSGLFKTVVDALDSIIAISRNFFCECNEQSQIKPLGRLIKAIMLEIPYCDTKLIRSGENLWKVIIEAILHVKKHNTSFGEEKQKMACEVLIASSGGTTSPQGYMRGMSLPAQTWFMSESPSATSFIKRLLESFSQSEQTIRILSSVLRTLPGIALQRWERMLTIFKEIGHGSNKKDLMCMEVLESFMLGRKDFEVSEDLKSKNDRIIIDLDDIMLTQWKQNSLQRVMHIFAAFRSQDWVQLEQIEGRVSCHLETILLGCQNPSAKIREGAARAVGEFCTQYIVCDSSSGKAVKGTKLKHYQPLAYKIYAVMLELCRDNNAGARSMSIFSLGNLACALTGLNTKEVLEIPKLLKMHKAMLCSFNDANDKVVKNAIRSVGHTSNLLASSLRHGGGCDEYFTASCKLLVEVIESLTLKLWNTLHVALNEKQKAAMTWKERSAAKKHGWGACYSLGLVFERLCLGIFEDYDGLVLACSKATLCLVRCACHHSVLNEKVVLATMAAICHLPSHFFFKNESQDTLLGDALTTSILILEMSARARVLLLKSSDNNNRVTAKLAAQNEPFLLHLLNSTSIADVTIVLSDDRITNQTLGMLYSWMVEGPIFYGLSARAFEMFALALQQPGRWSTGVEFEQKFTSRALQKYKQERLSMHTENRSNDSRPEQTSNDDDEVDEL